MKINVFKKKFKQLSVEQMKTAITEMKKAKESGVAFENVASSDLEKTKKAFDDLITWCEINMAGREMSEKLDLPII